MIRQKVLRPDAVLQTDDGPIPYLSREALEEALLEMAPLLELMGGGLTIQTKRYPSGQPNESVTMGAVIQWWSHSQRTSKPQPEEHGELDDPTPEQFEAQLEAEGEREPEPVEG